MIRQKWVRYLKRLLPVLVAVSMMAGSSFAVEFDLWAKEFTKTLPDGTEVVMWGFAQSEGSDATVPGPLLVVDPADPTLTIHLHNTLPVPISLVIPGQAASLSPVRFTDDQGRERVRSFTTETAPAGTGTYTWNNLKPGAYLYHSGTHPAVQVQMGLYGGMVKDAAAGEAYAGIAYDNQVILLYSEIDPALHDAVASGTYGTPAYPSTLEYKPGYFLINGEPYSAAAPIMSVYLHEQVLLRFLNAGLKTHVPLLLGSYLKIVSEDGNVYSYPKEQYSVLLPAGKTTDAVFTPQEAKRYPLFDRALCLTSGGAPNGGMLAYLDVTAGAGVPEAVNDLYTVGEDETLTVNVSDGVLANDTGTDLTAVLVTDVHAGSLTLNADGSFEYTPNPDFNGTDFFTYKAVSGMQPSNTATVTLLVTPVNDAPVAVNDAYETMEGQMLHVVAPGVLGNDTDVDSDHLMAVGDSGPAHGMLTLNTDGSFEYMPEAGYSGMDSFTYRASDGELESDPATVTLMIHAHVNTPPVAVDDYAETARNTPVFIDLIANDTDADGNHTIHPNSITIVTQPTRGASVSVLTGGVIFTPKKNFRGTDVFTYNIKDVEGAVSNTATVRVNVVK